tara:strand:- start:982 stop:1935 length:954 start_codon:yes stop_codon:yes gene_type:complete
MNILIILNRLFLKLFTIFTCLFFISWIYASPMPGTTDVKGTFSPNSCISELKKGKSKLSCEGISFNLNVPKQCLDKSCGLILDVHGWQMSATLQDMHTQLSKIGAEHSYIVIQPNANKTTFGRSWSEKDDEKVFFILNSVKEAYQVMGERIHITGFSQGGFMSWRFICKYSDVLASAAPLAYGAVRYNRQERPVTSEVMSDCFQDGQIDILYGHGQKDGLVPYAGAMQTLKLILPNWKMNQREVIGSADDYKHIRFYNDQGTSFEFINFNWVINTKSMSNLGGHCFPGSGGYLGCGKDNAINWGEEVVKFFLKHPKN